MKNLRENDEGKEREGKGCGCLGVFEAYAKESVVWSTYSGIFIEKKAN